MLLDHAARTFARSYEPSASRSIRPAFSARRTAVSLTPIWRASSKAQLVAQIMAYTADYNATKAHSFQWTYAGPPLAA